MSTKMRQVSKEEFEILTRFHPGEVRYYVDVDRALPSRHKGARVNVKRKPVKRPGAAMKAAAKRGLRGGNNRANASKFVQLTTKGAGRMRPESLQYKLYCSATRILNEDPTKILKRSDLTVRLVEANPANDKVSQIVPAISSLIKGGYLRYTGAAN